MIERKVVAAGLTGRVAGHSTRRGFTTDLAHRQLGTDVSGLPEVARDVLDDPMVHLDGYRHGVSPGHGPADGESGGAVGFGGLLLSRFHSTRELYEGMAALRAAGVSVVDPHTWTLSGDLDPIRTAAARFDPDGLLNPGKLPPPR